jgi:hypothetical protein
MIKNRVDEVKAAAGITTEWLAKDVKRLMEKCEESDPKVSAQSQRLLSEIIGAQQPIKHSVETVDKTPIQIMGFDPSKLPRKSELTDEKPPEDG